MPTVFPDEYDTRLNPNEDTAMSDAGFEHDLQHIDLNDILTAIQHRIGTRGSLDPETLTGQAGAAASHITILLGAVDTLTAQLGITNANLTEVQETLADVPNQITELTTTKLDLSGGAMSGQLVIAYPPAPVVAESFNTAQLLLSNTEATDNPPQLGFRSIGQLGLDLYLDANGLSAISSLGGQSLIINDQGRLNGQSFGDGSVPAAKLVPGSVSGMQLGTNSVTFDKIAPGAVDASKFTAGTMAQIQAAAGCPIGTIVMFGGWAGAAPPAGWFACDGTPVNRITFAALWGILGTQYGPGDGVNTFNLPDFRSRSPMGAGTGGDLPEIHSGWKGGEWDHVLSVNELAHHDHAVYDPTHSHGIYQIPHAHSISDPGHGHAVADSGHGHPLGAYGGFTPGATGFYSAQGADVNGQIARTNIGIYGSGTGIGIYGANANLSIYGAGTGIAIYGAGGNAGHNTVHPVLGVQFIVRAT